MTSDTLSLFIWSSTLFSAINTTGSPHHPGSYTSLQRPSARKPSLLSLDDMAMQSSLSLSPAAINTFPPKERKFLMQEWLCTAHGGNSCPHPLPRPWISFPVPGKYQGLLASRKRKPAFTAVNRVLRAGFKTEVPKRFAHNKPCRDIDHGNARYFAHDGNCLARAVDFNDVYPCYRNL